MLSLLGTGSISRRSRWALALAGTAAAVAMSTTANATPTLVQSQGVVQATTILPFNGGSDLGNPMVVSPTSTFSIAVVGFNANGSGSFLTAAEQTPFGVHADLHRCRSGEPGLDGHLERIGRGDHHDRSVYHQRSDQFDPSGTTVGSPAGAVTEMEADIGGYNAGADPIIFAVPINPTSLVATGNMVYSGGTFALNPSPNDSLDPTDTMLISAEGVNAGGSPLSGFDIHSFTFSFTYANPVPEPTSAGILVAAAGAALLRRRRVVSV